jgi:carbonic anhydrase
MSSRMLSPADALVRLREGNCRFVASRATASAPSPAHRAALVAGQAPFAIVLGCSDSRVPAELVFDQGFGDLFVIRVAGNIVAPSQIGSVEFAVSRFGTPLVVVMGHTHCGAILATLEEVQGRASASSRGERAIVDRIRPAVETLLTGRPETDPDRLMREAVSANVRASVNHLRYGSALIEERVLKHGLMVVGAVYSLETGMVSFDDVPPVD